MKFGITFRQHQLIIIIFANLIQYIYKFAIRELQILFLDMAKNHNGMRPQDIVIFPVVKIIRFVRMRCWRCKVSSVRRPIVPTLTLYGV